MIAFPVPFTSLLLAAGSISREEILRLSTIPDARNESPPNTPDEDYVQTPRLSLGGGPMPSDSRRSRDGSLSSLPPRAAGRLRAPWPWVAGSKDRPLGSVSRGSVCPRFLANFSPGLRGGKSPCVLGTPQAGGRARPTHSVLRVLAQLTLRAKLAKRETT